MVEKILIVSSVAKMFLPKHIHGYRFIYADIKNYIDMIKHCDFVIAGMEPYTKEILDGAKHLRLISRCGHGTDNISKGIVPIRDCRGCLDRTIAEVVIGYIIMCQRSLKQIDTSCHNGIWDRVIGNTLEDKTLGIIGYGGIGETVGVLASKLDMNILHYDIISERSNCTLDHLLKESDIITLHCDLNPSSKHIINKDTICRMKKDIILINTSRGFMINERDLLLYHRRFKYIVLDVFEDEPLPVDSPLFSCSNIVFGIHSAGSSFEGLKCMVRMSLDNIINF